MRVLIACECSGTVRDAFVACGHEVWSCDLLPTERPGLHYQGDVLRILDGWTPARHTSECDPEGDGWCQLTDSDPSECKCYGPTQDGVEYLESEGELFARPIDRPHWDLMIAHPPCDYLTNSAAWAYKDPDFRRYPGVGYHQRVQQGTLTGECRRHARVLAQRFFLHLWRAPIARICIENPIGAMNTHPELPDDLPGRQIIQPHQFGDDASKATCLWLKGLPPLQGTLDYPPRLVNYKGKTVKRWSNQTDSGQNCLPPSVSRASVRAVTYSGIAQAMADQWG